MSVYRAKARVETRAESDGLIGSTYNAAEFVNDLRALPSRTSHPLVQPNSGLSLRFTPA